MARLPDNEIERLKKQVALARLVRGFRVELKRHGAETTMTELRRSRVVMTRFCQVTSARTLQLEFI